MRLVILRARQIKRSSSRFSPSRLLIESSNHKEPGCGGCSYSIVLPCEMPQSSASLNAFFQTGRAFAGKICLTCFPKMTAGEKLVIGDEPFADKQLPSRSISNNKSGIV